MKPSIKKLCRVLIEDFDTQSLETVMNDLQEQIKQQYDYFQKYDTVDRFQIVYGIFSLGNFGSFDWAERVFPKLNLVSIFNYQEDDFHLTTCENCEGDGRLNCENCDGTGYVPCDNCDGEGELECSVCMGRGNIDGEECDECQGSENVPCSVCDGESTIECSWCDRSGDYECETCDGSGEIQTDSMNYMVYNFLIYDEKLIRYLKERDEIDRPIGKDLDFREKFSFLEPYNIFQISNEMRNEKFASFVQPDYDYCFYVEPLSNENVRWHLIRHEVFTYLTEGSATKYLQY